MKNPLQEEFNELESYLKLGNITNLEVSKEGIYWHVDHSYRILEGVPEMLRLSKKEDYKPKTSIIKWVIMTFKWIPRGKGVSPKNVVPDENHLSIEEIKSRGEEAYARVNSIHELPEWAHFRHPLFGSLKRDETVKFLGIHTNHHLKIMRDIIKGT
ncbi:hypothetical protein [Nonlabens antarcticus]|uniref:hypothetical protein n=1 Tax=Nonlabens antarcticus TaxID=392714 RepID=UPI0018917CBE|nr:hypothetical protein [Nonlabens antarcticus]